jgi:hypothetical protein
MTACPKCIEAKYEEESLGSSRRSGRSERSQDEHRSRSRSDSKFHAAIALQKCSSESGTIFKIF